MLRLLVPLLIFCLSGVSDPALGQERSLLRIGVLGPLSGNIMSMDCRSASDPGGDFAGFAAWLPVNGPGNHDLLLSTGDILGDDPLSRYLVTGGPRTIKRLADLITGLGLDSSVPGLGEFSLPGGLSIPVIKELQSRGIPYGAANVLCAAEGGTLCRHLLRMGTRITEVRGLKIGIINLIGEGLVSEADQRNLDMAQILPPAETADLLAQRMKTRESVDLVVAMVNLETTGSQGEQAIRFARAVRNVDLILTGAPHGEPVESGSRQYPAEGPDSELLSPLGLDLVQLDDGQRYLVFAGPGLSRLTTLSIELARNPGPHISGLHLERVPIPRAREKSQVASTLAQTRSEFCALSVRPLNSGRLKTSMSSSQFLIYVIEVMRRAASSDLGVLTTRTIGSGLGRRLEGAITSEDLSLMLSREELSVLEIKGEHLKTHLKLLLDPARRPEDVVVVGASMDGDKLLINGRLLEDARPYRIATTSFLAMGGRGLLQPLLAKASREVSSPPMFIREVVRRFLERDRPRLLGANTPIDPDTDFVSLWSLPRWDFSNTTTLSFNQVYIANPGGYQETQLSRSEILGMSGDLQGQIQMSDQAMIWNNFLHLQYGRADIAGKGLSETKDLQSLETTWSWTWLRNTYTAGQLWIPVPMLKAKLESEFTKVPEAGYHHLEGTLSAGPQWLIGDRFSVSVGYGLRKELLDPSDHLHHGIDFSYQANKIPLVTKDGQNLVELDSRFELFFSDPGSRNRLQGTGNTSVSLALWEWFRVSVGFNLYLFMDESRDLSMSLDTDAGLSMAATFAFQRFW